jgi:predicted phage terminase large subunit-like protein
MSCAREGSQQTFSLRDIDLIEAKAKAEARRNVWAYIRYMDPRLKLGWWQKDAAKHLQQFYEDLKSGKRPKLVIEAPPQHGKSRLIVDFISWLCGREPDLKTIYTSFSERLGIRANLRLQRIIDSERYQSLFPDTRLNATNVVTISGQYLRNREILEFVGKEGSFRNTTVRGSITGESLDLGVIDDPIKGREEANSESIRDKTWDWMMDDFFTRFSEDAGLLAILTRWHLDDPIGRLLEVSDDIKVLKYKAIAEEDEEHRKAGEALFPEHKSLEFLLERKSKMLPASWEALYQQNPVVRGGALFPVERFRIDAHNPIKSEIVKSVRYWDKAGTSGGGAYTAGVLMHKMNDGRYVVSDVIRGQWSALDRERRIKQTAEADGNNVHIWIEQEPGSGGKESAESTIRNLAGFRVHADKVTGDKETRAEPYAAQVQSGNVHLVQGEWCRGFIGEHETFPSGKYKDQVDAAAGAFAKLATKEFFVI